MSDAWLVDAAFRLGVVFAILFVNAFFVAAEFAIVTIRRTRVEQMVEEGVPLARSVQRGVLEPDSFIAAAQLGITMASLALGWVGEPTLASLLESLFAFLPAPWAAISAHSVAVTIAFAIITALHVILAEQVPKVMAIQYAEQVALATAPLTLLFGRLFWPFIWLISGATRLLLRLLGLRPPVGHYLVHSVEELKMLVTASREAGVLEEAEEEIVERAFDFGELTAREVMVPRTEMVAIPIGIRLGELLDLVTRSPHTRFPVYENTIDNIVGILHIRDLLRVLAERLPRDEPFDLRPLMRPALVVPETVTTTQLLNEMRRRKTHIAIVVDEFGGTAGLVTLEDLLERLVGTVQDEFEPPQIDIQPQPDGTVLINGLVLIGEVNERLKLHLPEEEYDTVGGYVFGQLGRKPEVGDEVPANGGRLRVEAVDGLRVALVRYIPPAGVAAVAVED